MARKSICKKSLECISKIGWRCFSPSALAQFLDMPLHVVLDSLPNKESLMPLLWKDMRAYVIAKNTPHDLREATPQERLQELFLCYIDYLSPHKRAIQTILKESWNTPTLPFITAKSWVCETKFIFEYAELSTFGPIGAVKIKILSALYAASFAVWLADTSPGMDKTMPFLDQCLTWCSMHLQRYDSA